MNAGVRKFRTPTPRVAGVLARDTLFHTELERAKRATNLRAEPAFVLGREAPRICICICGRSPHFAGSFAPRICIGARSAPHFILKIGGAILISQSSPHFHFRFVVEFDCTTYIKILKGLVFQGLIFSRILKKRLHIWRFKPFEIFETSSRSPEMAKKPL
jgi:hypothetical protein